MNKDRKFSIVFAITSTLLLCMMLLAFFGNLSFRFQEVEDNYKHSRVINLCEETSSQELSQLLMANDYVTNQRDADFVADTLVARLRSGMEFSNLFHLQKRDYGQVSALVAEREGVLKDKVTESYKKLGLTDDLPLVETLDTQLDLARTGDTGTIVVLVYEEVSKGLILDKIGFPKKEENCEGVTVRLMEYYVDSVEHADVVGYAKTDNEGRAIFRGLDRSRGYSVLPIKKGYEYGSSKGIVQGNFDRYKLFGRFLENNPFEKPFKFRQREHRIQMIDNDTIERIKEDGTITIRTPEDFKSTVTWCFILFFLFWWAFILWKAFVSPNKFDFASGLVVAATMFLTGLCIVMMFAIQSPLTEELRGVNMAKHILILGMPVICILQFKRVDFVKFHQNFNCRELVKSSRNINYKRDLIWIVLAVLLTVALFTPLGKEIGGMRVNLNVFGRPIQPSEVVKLLILFYLASFFSRNAGAIISYSQPKQTKNWAKVKTLSLVIASLVLLLGLYFGLNDLGPALVIGFTFIILYSLEKSKVKLDNLSDNEKTKGKFNCDFAMLIYGSLSFGLLIFIGHLLPGAKTSLGFACLWFPLWILFGIFYQKRKQFFESAFIFNMLVFAFVFFGDVAKNVPIPVIQDTAERFEQRVDMCVNTWGDLDVDMDHPDYMHGKDAKPVCNTQVVNGLWAIATGGFTGQGLGNGNPNFIPAFNTDMILPAMAEQIGWCGLVFVLFVFALLLWGIIKIGLNVGNTFAFFFCVGVAVVIAVQFFIIALGSSGVIPLTGVAVPFLSYGGTSMVCNLVAVGMVLSLSKNMKSELTENEKRMQKISIEGYKPAMGVAVIPACIIVVVLVYAWTHYSVLAGNSTLIQPAYVLSKEGYPVIEYNPRIALLTKRMWVGNIYDRNDVLLATSDKTKLEEYISQYEDCGLSRTEINKIAQAHTKRYYPFAEHLFFMLGGQNTSLYYDYYEDQPIGYMAEKQLLSYLRGFDNRHDKKGRPTAKVTLSSDKVKSKYSYLNNTTKENVAYALYDYHELVPFLKSGVYGKKLRKHNESVQKGDYDLYLTIDAKLQTDMQQQIEEYVRKKYSDKNLLRISVVVLDAQNGDLLTSANYPLPDYQRLLMEDSIAKANGKKGAVYSDNNRSWRWQAYTDRDLGLTYQTFPGSTAKVMSTMAGFQKMGDDAARKTYHITIDDIIERGSVKEPHEGQKYPNRDDFHRYKNTAVRNVDMWVAIVESSNCYFVNLVNDNDLYDELANIYEAAGVSVGNTTPYYLTNEYTPERKRVFRKKVETNRREALKKYEKYKEKNEHKIMDAREWKWAWGQGYEHYELQASPLNMARVVSAVVNKGKMPVTQYVMSKSRYAKKLRNEQEIELLSSSSAKTLKKYMLDEAKNQKKRQERHKNGEIVTVELPGYVGGKTGTPERYHYVNRKRETLNDGWYMFFVEGKYCKDGHPLAVAVRMERGVGSSSAVFLAKQVVLEALYANGYIKR